MRTGARRDGGDAQDPAALPPLFSTPTARPGRQRGSFSMTPPSDPPPPVPLDEARRRYHSASQPTLPAHPPTGRHQDGTGEVDWVQVAMFRTMVATPLVVIDGKRGPLRTGDLPIYALPALILDLLGDERDTMLRFAARADDAVRVRPLPGVHFTLDGEALTVCRSGELQSACEPSSAWVEAIGVLKRDLFSGEQHALNAAERLRGLQTVELEAEDVEASAASEEILPGNDNDV